jgi:phosphate transport system substrate-binding protein
MGGLVQTKTRRFTMLLAALVALALLGSACSSSKKKASNTGTGSSSSSTSTTAAVGGGTFDQATYGKASGSLTGSGSTFQKPFDDGAIQALKALVPTLSISYGGGGSGKGKTDLAAGTVDFAGTDSLIKDADKATYKGAFLYFPTVAAPITVSYNLSGVKDLKLDGPTIAKIYTGKITTWNDPAIAALNSGTTLPSDPITACARAEASGTTSNFTKFLYATDPTDFTTPASDQPTIWTLASIQKSQGNGGVAACVNGKSGAIGYVDFSDAKSQSLNFASIKNKNGEFVVASLDGAGKAVAGATVKPDLTYDPIDAAGAGAYPITSPTWVVVYVKQPSADKALAVKAFLSFLLTDGQQLASPSNYSALPTSLAKQALAQVAQITS